MTSWSLLISIPLGDTLCLWTSLTLTPDCCRLSPILVLQSLSFLLVLCSPLCNKFHRWSSPILILSFSTSGSIPRIPESPVKLESLVDSLSRLGSSLSSESLFQVFFFCQSVSTFASWSPFCLFLFCSQSGSVLCLVWYFNLTLVLQYSSGYTMIIIVQFSTPGYGFCVITTSGKFPLLFPWLCMNLLGLPCYSTCLVLLLSLGSVREHSKASQNMLNYSRRGILSQINE